MTDDPTEDAQPTEPSDTGAPARRGPALVLAVTAAVLLGIAAVVLAILLAGAEDTDPRLADVRRTAGQFGEALVTYDHTDPDEHREAVLALSTGSFRDEYEDAFDQGLAQIISEVEATSTGFVKDVYVSELGEDDAEAIVVVDIEHTGSGGPRTLFDVYFRLTLVELDAGWRIDQVTDLSFDSGATPSDGTGGTTTTTVSGATTSSIP